MSNGSPTAYLLWAILACIFLAFLLLHLWAYDRFNCLKWDSGRQPGAFKRVMTYSYIGTLPLLVVFGVAMTVFKFKAGYVMMPDGTIIPRPLTIWASADKHWLLPLYFVLSIAWSLELVTHLEELSFWLFLLHQGPGKREWFESWEFRIWYLGSMVAVLGMPLVTLVTRRDIERVQAWIFLAGASAGTTTTVFFLYVLARFPGFIVYVKDGGAESDVVVRLATFYQLNRIRVIFRFLFTVPLLMIGIDALSGPYPIIGNPFAVDFLLMIGGIGCFISSAITLFIFFPRSITQESGYGAKAVPPSPNAVKIPTVISPSQNYFPQEQDPQTPKVYYDGGPDEVTMQMGAFRYPDDPPHNTINCSRYAMSPGNRPARSAESEAELSPGYESDAESFGMAPSPTLPFHQKSPSHPPDTQTGASRSNSGGRSDDTVWERPNEYPFPHTQGHTDILPTSSLTTRRRPRSDGPFVYNSEGVIVSTVTGLPNNPSRTTSESQPGPRLNNRDRENIPSQLHPYLMNFTSPIDLLDNSPLQHVEEWRPPHVV